MTPAVIDLSHLAPTTIACRRLDKPALDISLTVEVKFSHHCYTKTIVDEKVEGQRITERGETRLFCTDRWNMSRIYLPNMIAELPTSKVEHTWERRNYRYVLNATTVDGKEYNLFFILRKSGQNTNSDLLLFVESAYPVPSDPKRKAPGTIRFAMLATKVFLGEKVSLPPRR